MKKSILISVLLGLSLNIIAQKVDLEKVTKEQLEEKVHPKDTSAVAAILFKKARTTFNYTVNDGFTTKTEFSIKLKIYKKEGLKWANFEIPYYVGYKTLNDEQVNILKAFTYNIDNGKIVKVKVSGESKFKEKINEFWDTKIVTFPNVKEGSIIELQYEFKSDNLSKLPDFQYQYKIPVNFAQLTTEIPGFYLYKAIKVGFVDVTINDKIENASKEYFDGRAITNYLTYQQIKTVYEVSNVPALIEEDFVSNIDNYYGKIEHELNTIQFPNEPVKQIATTWESVAKSIYEEKDFGNELNKTSYFLSDLKNITDKTTSKEERLKAIYEFVKQRMTWNGKFGYYAKDGVEKAYKETIGNVAELNLILTSMLKMGGLDASPVLLSTRDNGVPLFPNRSKFNYVIVVVNLEGKQILLDATDKFCSIDILPIRDLNDKGRQINNDGSSAEINVMPNYNSLHNMNILASVDRNGDISGQVREQYFDYNGLRFRENYSGIAKDSYIEKLEKRYPGLEIENYEVKNDKAVYEPIIESYYIKNKSVIEKIGDKMFFSPMLYLASQQNPFKQDNRQYPIDFAFPYKDKYAFVITIPDGYEVESLPKPVALAMDKGYGNFSIVISNTDNQIQVSVSLSINTSIIPSEDYDTLKEFFKKVIEKENEKIVLKKV